MVLNETQRAIEHAARSFAQERLVPAAREHEQAGCYPRALLAELGALGFMGMSAPARFRGAEMDAVSSTLVLMELAAGDGALSTIVSIQNSIIIPALLRHGRAGQQERFLPALAEGRLIGAFALSEADAGSDAAAIRTRATAVAGGWRIDGSKQFITSGKLGGLALVIAVTDAAAGKKGMSAFLVPTDRPGYVVEKVEHKLGQAASDTCALRFDGVFVEDDLLLGRPGEGYPIALANLEVGRIGIAAQSVGMAQAAMAIAVGYARDRTTMGRPIIEHQAVGFRLADLAARLAAARQLTLHAASLKEDGVPCLTEACMAKLVASETAEAVVSGALQTLGGYGYLEEFGLAKIYRDVRVCQIYEGTSDIQRMIIARSL